MELRVYQTSEWLLCLMIKGQFTNRFFFFFFIIKVKVCSFRGSNFDSFGSLNLLRNISVLTGKHLLVWGSFPLTKDLGPVVQN